MVTGLMVGLAALTHTNAALLVVPLAFRRCVEPRCRHTCGACRRRR